MKPALLFLVTFAVMVAGSIGLVRAGMALGSAARTADELDVASCDKARGVFAYFNGAPRVCVRRESLVDIRAQH